MASCTTQEWVALGGVSPPWPAGGIRPVLHSSPARTPSQCFFHMGEDFTLFQGLGWKRGYM